MAHYAVALRKESVDRNLIVRSCCISRFASLSARRAWIEIKSTAAPSWAWRVALRKESVDRNGVVDDTDHRQFRSLSARRAWIEIMRVKSSRFPSSCRSPQGERG